MKINSSSEINIKSPFRINILAIQPSQLYINLNKLEKIKKLIVIDNSFNNDPLPVKMLNDKIIFTDGHTRALFYYLEGFTDLLVEWDDPWDSENLDEKLYEISVQWCIDEGIRSIKDLENRIISDSDYQKLWLNRCKKMHNNSSLNDF